MQTSSHIRPAVWDVCPASTRPLTAHTSASITGIFSSKRSGGDAIYRDIDLQQVFIPQDARDCREWLPQKLEGPADLTLKDVDVELAELHEHKRFRDSSPRPVLALLDEPAAPHRVVLGAPGAGKSSLTRIRLLEWAKSDASDRPVPVLVELRRFHRSQYDDVFEYLENDKDLLFRFDAAVADKILGPLLDDAKASEVGDAEFEGKPHPFVLACKVIARAREAEKLSMTAACARTALEEWLAADVGYANGDGWVGLLANTFPDGKTREILEELAKTASDFFAVSKAVASLAEHFGDAQTRALLEEMVRRDEDTGARRRAVVSLVEHFADAQTRALLEEVVMTPNGREVVERAANWIRDDSSKYLQLLLRNSNDVDP